MASDSPPDAEATIFGSTVSARGGAMHASEARTSPQAGDVERAEHGGRGPFFRTDARTLMMLLMLGVATTAIQSVTERIDVAISGGAGAWVGHVSWTTMAFVTIILYGPMTPIQSVISPVIGLLTGSSPYSWVWIIQNAIITFILGTIAWYGRFRWDQNRGLIILSIIYAFILVPISYTSSSVLVFGVPLQPAFISSLVYIPLSFIAVPLAKILLQAIQAADLD
jgi:hypothetical protein